MSYQKKFQVWLLRGMWWISPLALCGAAGSMAHGETVEGFLEPNQRIEVSSSNDPSTVQQILVREGDRVSQGELLATLDTSVLEASLAIARRRATMRGRLEAAEAEMSLRQDRFNKLHELRQKGHASIAELERAQADAAVANAQWALAKEELELAGLECQMIEAQIRERQFLSPIDGQVVETFKEVGEITTLGDPRLMTLVQLDPLRVKFPVSVSAGTKLQTGDPLTLELPEIEMSTPAVIEVVSPVLDPKSGTVQLTCIVKNPQGKIRSGMRCLLRLDDEHPNTSKLSNNVPSASN
jgi:RND family efflux transporter MFP subunit